MKIAPSAMAGEAEMLSPRSFTAKNSHLGVAVMTLTLPSALAK
jgi:hypothetical protein